MPPMETLLPLLVILLSYLLGSIPSGVLVARLGGGTDPRSVGSGNIGATNVLRAMGPGAAVATLAGDVLKGLLPPLAAGWLGGHPHLPLAAAGMAILGHNFPVFLGFRGGKGVATTFGAFLALDPLLAILALGVWVTGVAVSRYSSVGAIAAAAASPLLALLARRPASLTWFVAGAAALLLLRHAGNLRRLWAGTENPIRLGRKGRDG